VFSSQKLISKLLFAECALTGVFVCSGIKQKHVLTR